VRTAACPRGTAISTGWAWFPVEQPGQRTQCPVEEPISNPDGQVYDADLRRHGRLIPISLEEPADRSVQEVHYQCLFGNHLRPRLSPTMWIRPKDRTHVDAAHKRAFAPVKVAVEDERSHRGPVATFVRRVLSLVVVRIIHH
jgi:hypothetical protein